MGTAVGRVLAGVTGLGSAYLTAVFVAWTSWSSAETFATWAQGSVPLIGAAAVSGVAAAWLLLGGLLGRRPPLGSVVAMGLLPAVLTVLTAPLRY